MKSEEESSNLPEPKDWKMLSYQSNFYAEENYDQHGNYLGDGEYDEEEECCNMGWEAKDSVLASEIFVFLEW